MRSILISIAMFGLLVGAVGCAAEASEVRADGDGHIHEARGTSGEGAPADGAAAATARTGVVEIVATGHTLEMPDEIPSGWTTFRLVNRTAETHFALFGLLPEGRTVADSEAEVVPVFQDAMDLIAAGDPDTGFAEFARLPAWFEDVVYSGGPGFVGPGETAETTMYVEPGTYAVECYVKSAGVFHTTHGMITELTVTEQETDAPEPRADLEVTVSSDRGIELGGRVRPGRQTIAVHFEDQIVHGNVLGHDVHLARIDDDTDLDGLATWMNWIVGLDEPAPAEFIGGAQSMPAGSTAYIDVTLTPGDYAFIAEVDDPDDKGMLQVVSVPDGR
jgi:hypothetical protein